jgi:L-seryl-tRNA(Ser) seleniumtransferase
MQATVDLHFRADDDGHVSDDIPIVSMLRAKVDSLLERARALVESLADLPMAIEIGSGNSKVGGGTLPRAALPSIMLDLVPHTIRLEEFSARLRRAPVAVIGFVSANRLKIDLRTVFPGQDRQLAESIRAALNAGARDG